MGAAPKKNDIKIDPIPIPDLTNTNPDVAAELETQQKKRAMQYGIMRTFTGAGNKAAMVKTNQKSLLGDNSVLGS